MFHLMFLPLGYPVAIAGLIIIGLGCAPIYPCIIHSTPDNFGADKSQAIIGVQMASAYMGSLAMPALLGLIANPDIPCAIPIHIPGIGFSNNPVTNTTISEINIVQLIMFLIPLYMKYNPMGFICPL